MLKIEEIRVFLAERPLLTQRGLSLESGLSDSLLCKILRGQRNITEDVSINELMIPEQIEVNK